MGLAFPPECALRKVEQEKQMRGKPGNLSSNRFSPTSWKTLDSSLEATLTCCSSSFSSLASNLAKCLCSIFFTAASPLQKDHFANLRHSYKDFNNQQECHCIQLPCSACWYCFLDLWRQSLYLVLWRIVLVNIVILPLYLALWTIESRKVGRKNSLSVFLQIGSTFE